MARRSTLLAVSCACLFILMHCIPTCYALDLSAAEKEFLRAKDTIVFVSQTQYPPFEFTTANQQHEGMMLDVVRWMAVEIGFHPIFIDMPFLEAQEAVLAGKADILTSLFSSEQRKTRFEFTTTLFEVPASIFVKAERTDIKDLKDLENKTIAIQRGDYAKEFLISRKITFHTLDSQNFAEATDLVLAGTADAVIGDEQIVLHHIFSNQLADHIKKMGDPLYIGKNCMAANKSNRLLISILNKGIQEAKSKGVLDKISKKWLGTRYSPYASFWDRYGLPLSTAAGGLLFVSLGIWVWNIRLRSLVRKKTEEIVRNEQVLRDSEEKFRAIFENSLDGIFFTAPDSHVFSVNPAACAMLGRSEQEICAGGRDLVVDLTDPRLPEALAERARTGKFRGELNFKRKDGTSFPVELSTTLFQMGNGDLKSCILVRDITERKRAEAALQTSEERLRAAAKAAKFGVYSFDFDQNHTSYYSPEFLAIFGLPPDATLELDEDLIAKAHHPDDKPDFLAQVKGACDPCGTGILEHEYRIIRADGEVRWLRVIGQTIFSGKRPTDRPLRANGIIQDITERRLVEAVLRKNEERLTLAFKASQDAIWDWDLLTDAIYYSPRWFTMVGYEADELTIDTTLWQRLTHPDDLERITQVVRAAITGQQNSFEIETRRRHKLGHYIPILTRGFIQRDTSGKAVRISGINTDLTAQKLAEEERQQWERQRQQIKKAESLNRMAGAIAHNFNNLLGAVMGNLEMVKDSLRPTGPPLQQLTAALQAADQAAEVSSLMLTYLGQSIIELTPLDLTLLCRNSLPLINSAIKHGITLETDFPIPGPVVNANATQIQRLLKALVINGVEAMEGVQGSLYLSLGTVSATDIPTVHRFPIEWIPQDDLYACLAVRDSGVGIVSQDIEKLFDPFFSSKFTGRGLGLSVVLGILRSHSGGITVESEPGQGSVFTLYLPLSPEAIPQKLVAIDSDLARDMMGGTILLVEDEALIREMVETMLTRLGCTVLAATDGVEAVEVFRRHQTEIRAVVCDLTMPRMNGWQTLAALRALAPGLPVVLASGYDEAQVMQNTHPERPQSFLHKPFKQEELRLALAKALQSSLL